jgi:pimeloyl-ACP methyl ester carboxylesterase
MCQYGSGQANAMTALDAQVSHRMVEVAPGVRLHCVEAGHGPLVVLLHGFPEFWYSWRKQIPALVDAGFHVLAPDMRGYNLSDKPRGIQAYTTDILARDVACLIDACGEERASIVGHDWGGGVAWSFAMAYPDRLERLAILNVPHPLRLLQGLRTPRQLRKSWYIFFFQLPWLPEALARATNYVFVREGLRNGARAGAFSPEDIDRYVEAISRPGAVTSAINYYRALFRSGARSMRRLRRIDAPVLVIWGERDQYLGRELAQPDAAWVPHVHVERLSDAGHWVQNDQPDRVNELLLTFLRTR